MTVVIDPVRIDNWFLYEYFEGARDIDLNRYATLEELTHLVQEAGFVNVSVREVERVLFSWTAEEVLASPLVTRESNSLVALLPEDVFQRGLERIRASPRGTLFQTTMPFFAVTGYLPQL